MSCNRQGVGGAWLAAVPRNLATFFRNRRRLDMSIVSGPPKEVSYFEQKKIAQQMMQQQPAQH